MNNSLIFYFEPTKIVKHNVGHLYFPIFVKGQLEGYIRQAFRPDQDIDEALSTATPLPNETVLNTVPVNLN